jgi:excisionase family DNA binding protein
VTEDFSLRFPPELVDAIAAETARQITASGLAFSPWMNVDEAAAYLRIPKGRLQNLTAAGAIKVSRQGKAYTYHREWLDDFARKQAEDHVRSDLCKMARQRRNAPGPAPGGKS